MALIKHGHRLLCPVGSLNTGTLNGSKDWALKLGAQGQKKKRRQLWDSDRVMKPCIIQEVLPRLRTPDKSKHCTTGRSPRTCREPPREDKQGHHGLAQLGVGLSFAQWQDSQQGPNAVKFIIFIIL